MQELEELKKRLDEEVLPFIYEELQVSTTSAEAWLGQDPDWLDFGQVITSAVLRQGLSDILHLSRGLSLQHELQCFIVTGRVAG